MQFKSKEDHLSQVKQLQQQLQKNNKIFSLKNNADSNTLRNGDYKKNTLDLSAFSAIMEINPEEKWILVEPRLTFEKLCRYTLSQGLIPLVVPEFKSITVGGAIMGAALESSSHKFGQFNDTCLEYECLLGNGELIVASPSQNEDLFYACAGSYGTLALLTAIKLQLKEATKWVCLNYSKSTAEGAVDTLIAPLKSDFAEAIVYHPEKAVIITAEMSAEPLPKKFICKQRLWSRWYVQQVLETKNAQEYMTYYDYLFRLDRGGFWVGRYAHSFLTMSRFLLHLGIPKVQEKGTFNPNLFFRFLFGWSFSSQRLYQLWHRIPNSISENLFFIHDFYSPFARAKEVLGCFIKQTNIFPIWLCPIKGSQKPQFLSPHFGKTDFLNIGLYGIPRSQLSIPQLSALLEKQILDFGGRKMLYSFTYYDQEIFSKIYDDARYSALCKKYHATGVFPTLYEKVVSSHGV